MIPVLKYKSIEEYLAFEEESPEKNEYYQGNVFAMAGASFRHNQIVRNALTAIDNSLRGKECQVIPSDLKIHVESNTLFTYADLSIICGKPQFWNNRTDIIINPTAIIEVLSPSTKDYDHGGKFMLYRDIPALQEYIMISSTEIRFEKYNRQSVNEWKFTEYRSGENIIEIDTINFTIPLHEFYRDVDFSLAE